MTLPIFLVWAAVGDTFVPGLSLQDSAALILLAASLLVFRTFRERYLLIWTVGWLAYLVSRWTLQVWRQSRRHIISLRFPRPNSYWRLACLPLRSLSTRTRVKSFRECFL